MSARLHETHAPEAARLSAAWRSPAAWAFVALGLVGAFYLVTAHPEHLWGYVPYVLLLLCPLLHFFGHRGRHGA